MKKVLLLFISVIGSMAVTFAQDAGSRKLSVYEPGNRAQSVYFELLGPGLTYSFNYDTRFQNTLNGLGGRAGLGYISVEGNSVVSVPVMLNYLLGKEGKYFEMGLGATYIGFNSAESASDNEVLFIDDSQVFGTMVFGYRRQPVDGGFLFRAGLSPVFGSGNFIPYYGYIAFGYAF